MGRAGGVPDLWRGAILEYARRRRRSGRVRHLQRLSRASAPAGGTGGTRMKIDDVSLTIFTWDNIPATRYHLGSLASSASNLGLLRIHTDDGLEGHAFLGAATNP